MKKIILSISMLALASTVTFVACKKDNITSTQEQSTNKNPKSLMRNFKSIIPLFGSVGISVNWKDGCFHSVELYYPSGVIASRTIDCNPGCSFCMVTGSVIVNVQGMVTGNGNDIPYGLNVPYSDNPSQYSGMVMVNGTNLVFAVDKTKISSAILQSKFSGNTIDLSSGFAIDENTFNALNIDREHQLIPAGNYPLYEDGNIIYWEYPLN